MRSWVMAMVYNAVRTWLRENNIMHHEQALLPQSSWNVPRSATEALLPKMLNLIQQLKFKRPSARSVATALDRSVPMSDFHTCAPLNNNIGHRNYPATPSALDAYNI